MSGVLLSVDNLSKAFGGIQAVKDVSFTLAEGEIVGMIGPNGAGKTTLVNLVTGVFPASGGRVKFRGEDVTGQRPYQAARRGLARTFQIVQPFPAMTVLENVVAGALFAGAAPSRAEAEAEAMTHLEFVGREVQPRSSPPRARRPTAPARRLADAAIAQAPRTRQEPGDETALVAARRSQRRP